MASTITSTRLPSRSRWRILSLPLVFTPTIFTPSCRSIPSRINVLWRISAASPSSRPRIWGPSSIKVTRLPKRANDCAISQPMGPAPITAMRGGSSVREKMVSLVRYPASSNPGMGGAAARAPVQTAAFLKRSVLPATSTVSGPLKLPWPINTSIPSSSRKRRAES